MNTLLEFITLTKGTGYLIAIAFLLGFIAFWQWVHHGGKGLLTRVIPVAVLSLGFGGLAYTCISPKAVPTEAPPAAGAGAETPLLSSAVLAVMYGPASFGHELHQRVVKDCTLCHHYSTGRIPHCKECHGAPFNPENLNKPGITHVYHLRCISCHKENQLGPTDCTGCHTKAEIPPLSIAHPLTGVTNCLGCHGEKGIAGVTKVPADHAGANNGVCQLCHQPRVGEEDIAKLPHGVMGREGCLMCHGEGIAGAAKVPEDHAGRTNETCQICHRPQ